MLIEITERVEDGITFFSYNTPHPKTKCLEKFVDYILEGLKESANADGKVYINKTTWALTLGIHRRTLSRYIDQLIESNHLIEISYDDERYDKAKGKRLCCLQIVQEPFKYQKLLELHIRKAIEDLNNKSKSL